MSTGGVAAVAVGEEGGSRRTCRPVCIRVQVHWEDFGPCSAEDTLKVARVAGR